MKLEFALVALWLGALIGLPIALWTLGESARMPLVMLGVSAQAVLTMRLLWRKPGGWSALRLVLGVVVLGFLAEWMGSKTGFPFGVYRYTPALQPQLAGVPLLIPLAWLMMLPSAWAVASILARRFAPLSRFVWAQAGFSALAMTAWDLFLDPQMVTWGLWVWQDSAGGFFGIPWSNYAGWLLVSGGITLMLRPVNLPERPLLWMYLVTWILQTIGLAFFWGQPLPAMIGFLIMGSLGLSAWRHQ